MAFKLGPSKNHIDFTSGPILKQIIAFSVPNLLGNIFNALYNVVDSIVVGRFVGSGALAAVSCCTAITLVCAAIYVGFGVGSGVLTAQMYGAKQLQQLTATVNTAYIGGFFLGTLMILIGQLVCVPLLRLLNTPDSILQMAEIYMRIYFLGCTSQLFYHMGSGILRALGDSKWPTYLLVFCAVLNIVLDILFVAVLHWDCAGVALATLLAQLLSGIAIIWRIYTGGYGAKFTRKDFRLDPAIAKTVLRIGIPTSFQLLVTSLGSLIIQTYSNGFGEDLVATNGIVQKIENFALMPASSIATAMQMFVGQNLGANNDARCHRGIRRISVLIIASGALVGVVCMFLARPLCLIFVSNETVVQMGVQAIHITALFYVLHAVQSAMGAVLQGSAATKPVMYISFIGIAVRVVLCWLLGARTGIWQGLFWASNVYFAVVAALYALYVWKGDWRKYVAIRKEAEPAESPAQG